MPSRRQSLSPAPEVKHFRPDEIEQGITKLRRRGSQSPTERDHYTNGMAGSPIVARSGFPNLGYYFAFREAARAVLARAQKVGNPHVDAYPIGALYRHALELQLKELVRDTRKAVRLQLSHGERITDKQRKAARKYLEKNPPQGHPLIPLLHDAVSGLRLIGVTLPAGVKDTVKKMHDFDPTNEAFRYARKLDGKKPTTKQGSLLDIQAMASEVTAACKALGSAQNLACVHAQQIEDWVGECL